MLFRDLTVRTLTALPRGALAVISKRRNNSIIKEKHRRHQVKTIFEIHIGKR